MRNTKPAPDIANYAISKAGKTVVFLEKNVKRTTYTSYN